MTRAQVKPATIQSLHFGFIDRETFINNLIPVIIPWEKDLYIETLVADIEIIIESRYRRD